MMHVDLMSCMSCMTCGWGGIRSTCQAAAALVVFQMVLLGLDALAGDRYLKLTLPILIHAALQSLQLREGCLRCLRSGCVARMHYFPRASHRSTLLAPVALLSVEVRTCKGFGLESCTPAAFEGKLQHI